MVPHKLSSSLYLLLLTVVVLVPVISLAPPLASGDNMLWKSCDSVRKYTTNSTYQSNLKLLSTTLPRLTTLRSHRSISDAGALASTLDHTVSPAVRP